MITNSQVLTTVRKFHTSKDFDWPSSKLRHVIVLWPTRIRYLLANGYWFGRARLFPPSEQHSGNCGPGIRSCTMVERSGTRICCYSFYTYIGLVHEWSLWVHIFCLVTRCMELRVFLVASLNSKLLSATSENAFLRILSVFKTVRFSFCFGFSLLILISSVLLRQTAQGMPMQRSVSSYWRTNIFETTSGNFATNLLLFHKLEIGLDRILFSIDYPYVTIPEGSNWVNSLTNVLRPEELLSLKRGLAIDLLKLNDWGNRLNYVSEIFRYMFVDRLWIPRIRW